MISNLPNFSGRPWHSRNSLRCRQRGISIITGIFLLLLMSVLAAVIANVVSTAHVNQAADIGGARAYQAARAGAEWGMHKLDPYQLDPTNPGAADLPSCVNGNPPIPDHAVTVTCQSWDATEGTRQLRIYRIVSVAIAAGVKAPGIERQVEVTVEKCRDPSVITIAPYDC